MLNKIRAAVSLLSRRPVYLHYGITHRCNLSCRMCGVRPDPEGDELSLKQIRKAFSELKRSGVCYVSIGGGEPFLRADLTDAVRVILSLGFEVRLLTNGILASEERIKELSDSGLREVSVSLDSLDERKQGYLCAQDGAGDKILSALKRFSRIIPSKGRILLINTVVSPFNIDELPHLAEFAGKNGFYISFVPVEDNGLAEFQFKKGDAGRIDESYKALLLMKEKRGSAIFNSSLFLRNCRQFLKDGKRNWGCHAGKLYLSLSPEGKLTACHKSSGYLRVTESSFARDLGSADFARKNADLRNNCPGCMRPCWAEISLAVSDIKSFRQMCGLKLRTVK